jgi:carotenoid cleavage dioxygenase-like enzyme
VSLHVEQTPATAEANPYLEGPYAATHDELTVHGLEVLGGEIPDDLNGVYVRNGPNPQHHPVGRYHWFDGDGMVHSVHFADGMATYRNRWVRTEGFLAERDAGTAIWHGIMEPFGANPADAPEKDTANTDLVFHRDRLLALWYRAGKPYALDPVTLETLGPHDFDGTLRCEVSAHAKVDERTGELMFFDFGVKQPYMRYGVVGPEGTVRHFVPIDLPGPRLPHDMAITERHSILMDLPLLADPEAARRGRHRLDFQRDLPARFGVIPRYGGADEIRWFDADPCYIYHSVNARDDGDEVVLDVCRVKQPQPVAPDAGPLAQMLTYLRLDAHLHRYRFDLRTGRTREQVMDDDNSEFPSMNQGLIGRPARYTYNMHISPEKTLLFDGVMKYDVDHGTADTHWFGDGRWGSEAPFAPRPGAHAEDDGYLVSYVHDERDGSSEVHVLDARDMTAEPVCRLRLPVRVPLGFHATWIPGERLPGGSA